MCVTLPYKYVTTGGGSFFINCVVGICISHQRKDGKSRFDYLDPGCSWQAARLLEERFRRGLMSMSRVELESPRAEEVFEIAGLRLFLYPYNNGIFF
jgi:hypothetical protein